MICVLDDYSDSGGEDRVTGGGQEGWPVRSYYRSPRDMVSTYLHQPQEEMIWGPSGRLDGLLYKGEGEVELWGGT